MKKWQKIWLYGVVIYATLHLVRDLSQDVGFRNALSTPFVKQPASWYPWWYFWFFNTYVFALVEIILALVCLKRNKFELLGNITIILAVIIFSSWIVYWNFL